MNTQTEVASRSVSIYIDGELLKRFDKIARGSRRSRSSYISLLMERELERSEEKVVESQATPVA